MDIKNLKSAQVGYTNTPLEFLPNLTKKLGKGNLYVKRDDMSGLAMGGNKTRKLDYIVQYALDNGYTALMTFGGVQTNHGRLTVAAAVKCGLKPILVLNGSKPSYCSGNLILDRMMGADIIFIDTSSLEGLPKLEYEEKKLEFKEKCTREIIAKYEAQGEKVLNIPVGGQGVIGSAGYIQTVPEIMKQMEYQNINAKHIVVGYGSTGTFAGLWAGAKYYNAPFDVIGVAIEADHRTARATADFINELSTQYDMGFTCHPNELQIMIGTKDNPYYGIGYNEPDLETQKYMAMLAETDAVFTDPCYTGKVLHGFIDMVEKEIIPPCDDSIFLNTGGAPGIWTKEHLDSFQNYLWNDDKKITIMKL